MRSLIRIIAMAAWIAGICATMRLNIGCGLAYLLASTFLAMLVDAWRERRGL